MPELPEVETTRRGLETHVLNQKIVGAVVRVKKLRWPVNPVLGKILSKKTILNLDRRGKYLIFGFSHGNLLVHLGMSGSIRLVNVTTPVKPHEHIDLVLENEWILRYKDPRRFGAWLWLNGNDRSPLLDNLGPEPLTPDFSADYLYGLAQKSYRPIKNLIMDQKTVVGIGNIYATEALYLSGIHPNRNSSTIDHALCHLLVEHSKNILTRAIQRGGTTLRDFVSGQGDPGYFQQELWAYGRAKQKCKQCGELLQSVRIGQRQSVFCANCQK